MANRRRIVSCRSTCPLVAVSARPAVIPAPTAVRRIVIGMYRLAVTSGDRGSCELACTGNTEFPIHAHIAAATAGLGLEDQMSHLSSGGGACISMLAGKQLAAVEALKNSKD